MKIIGINYDMLISSAALVVDGEIVAAVAEERLNRDKKFRNFPRQSLSYCLERGGLEIRDIDYVAQAWNPGIHMEKFHPMASGRRRYRHEYLYSIPDHLVDFYQRPKINYIEQKHMLDTGETMSVLYLEHHFCHAANAFYLSPFDRAAVLTVDGRGERDTTCFFSAEQGNIELIDSVAFPDSLGSFYSSFTEFLGFKPENDEWKVMALSAMAPYENEFTSLIRDTISLIPDSGRFEIDRTLYKEHLYELPNYYSPKMIDLFGPPRKSSEPIEDRHCRIAAAMQAVAEEVMVHMLNYLQRVTGLDAVCCSGGFFMNSVFNGKINRKSSFNESFISSCPDDSGLSIGSALYAYHDLFKGSNRPIVRHNYYGPEYSDLEIYDVVKRFGLQAMASQPADIVDEVAQLLTEKRLVGWFQGAMEFGQRALGARSILADPRDAETKDRVNLAVKYREAFRPFAPAILEGRIEEYFDIDPGVTVPFMERVYPFKEEVREQVPAVVHDDGSGRLQGVSKETNPMFYGLIEAFEKLTGVPIVLNTSFNLNGDPIVCTPEDAIRTFMTCGLTHLAIGSYLLTKPE